MSAKRYEIENLAAIFKVHHLKAMKQQKEWLAHHRENYPDSVPPDNLTDDFSLSGALGVICNEIVKLKTSRAKVKKLS